MLMFVLREWRKKDVFLLITNVLTPWNSLVRIQWHRFGRSWRANTAATETWKKLEVKLNFYFDPQLDLLELEFGLLFGVCGSWTLSALRLGSKCAVNLRA